MAKRLRILVTSAGRRVELVRCFRAAAAALDTPLDVLACDLHPDLSPACRVADAAFAVPPAADSGYAEAVRSICVAEGVALVVPTIDPELLPLARARDRFGDGCAIAVSSPALVAMAADKLATAAFLAANGIASPRTMSFTDVLANPGTLGWPAFAKPLHGSASRGARMVASPAAIDDSSEPMIVQNLLVGAEYTVNMFFTHAGELRCAVPHERLQVRAGEVEKGVTRVVPALADAARRLASALPGPRGALCFQAIIDAEGQASVFEINARFGGGYPLADHAGASFARWLLEEALGLPSTAADHWRAGVTMLRYDAAVFTG